MYKNLNNEDVVGESIHLKSYFKDKTIKICQDEPEELTLEKYGLVSGSAVYFFGEPPPTEEERENYYNVQLKNREKIHRLVIADYVAPHDNLVRYLSNHEHNYISVVDDSSTKFGFVTSNFYFVNRHQALELYKQALKEDNKDIELTNLSKVFQLNSYHVNYSILKEMLEKRSLFI